MHKSFNPDIHHRKSIRLNHYDYSESGAYFITVCTKNFEHYFGNIQNGKMNLSMIGQIVHNEWIRTKQIRKNVALDEFIIMPNHFHGIIIINSVGAYWNTPLQRTFKSPSNNLGAIVRSFKSSVKRWCNKNNFANFQWQRNYYEHIVRNDFELNRIRKYIINNPINWELDRNNI